MNCYICKRVQLERENKSRDPHFIDEFETSLWILGDNQFYKGYSILIYKIHVEQLHNAIYPSSFLNLMIFVGEQIFHAFGPTRINYEILCNTNAHLHAHIIPRYQDDPHPFEPVWNYSKYYFKNDAYLAQTSTLRELKKSLLQ